MLRLLVSVAGLAFGHHGGSWRGAMAAKWWGAKAPSWILYQLENLSTGKSGVGKLMQVDSEREIGAGHLAVSPISD